MVFRLIMILLGIMMFPTVGYSQIPTLDMPGTLQAGNEVGQTLNSVKSSAESMNFLQKTSSAIGTYTKNVSEFISDQKEKVQKKLEKLERYKAQAEEYKAQIMAYKAQAEEAVNKVKEGVGQAKDAVKTAKSTVESVKDRVEDGVDQVKGAVDTAKSTVESVKDRVEDGVNQAKSMADGVKGRIEEGMDKVENTVGKEKGINSDEEAKIIEQETPTSTRKGFSSDRANNNHSSQRSVSSVTGSSIAPNINVGSAIANTQSAKLTEGSVSSSRSVSAVSLDTISSQDILPTGKSAIEAKVNASQEKLGVMSIQDVAVVTKDSDGDENKDGISSIKTEAKEILNANHKLVNSEKLNKDNAGNAISKSKKMDNIQAKPNKATVDDAKNITKDGNLKLNINKHDIKTKIVQPTRASFKTSFGYGHVHSSSTLAFAGGIKTGETPEGVVIVPKAISVRCNLNYEDAAKDTKYAKCLQSINDEAYSQDEKVSAEKRTDALKDLANSYLEMLASQYFEGLNIYNESFHFKNNEVDPIINSEITNVRDAWQYARDIDHIVGSRIDLFNKINSRALAVKAVGLYYQLGIETLKDEKTSVAN